ncbi:ran GTPase-activating protein 1 [Diachasma alloeum]|uniref:ran GTPase-activating protein 1 n=1 Tax=Diachasma alloeum TaxID=454923 RepID=UPI0007383015|nr:ran GTPase-activating protein 1 [Diachasma alloeum]
MSFNFKEISEQLNKASSDDRGTGVSFSGKSLKLNSEDDAKEVCDEIKKCENMGYLNLEGNTLGPDAAKAVAKALESHGSHLKYALWKDMFTGRMKTEIPKALEYLGDGLNRAGARLVELDLSDNAFGPIGIQALAAFLRSNTCYTLRVLRLNNNGLGTAGGKMLAEALLDCHANSSKEGQPLALRVFIAGRNRLENKGAKALADVFEKLGSLEEVVMPQNGIYHPGISALASGLSNNPGLRILNLNDNTVGPKGAQALADVLHNFKALECLNLGDCLLKTKGALVIADALGIQGNHISLTELNLAFNEIRTRAAESLARAVADKIQLTSLQLDGNAFGKSGRTALRNCLVSSERIESLGSLDEDATDDEESEDEETGREGEDGEEEKETEGSDQDDDVYIEKEQPVQTSIQEKSMKKPIEVKEFMKSSTGENLLLIEGDKVTAFLEYAKTLCQGENCQESEKYVDELLHIVMKVSSHCGSGYADVRIEAERLTDLLYSALFHYALENDQMSKLNNNLLVDLGLIKSEDKSGGKIDWNLEGCFKALEKVVQKDYFPSLTKDALKLFIEKPIKTGRKFVDPFQEVKISLKAVLDKLPST